MATFMTVVWACAAAVFVVFVAANLVPELRRHRLLLVAGVFLSGLVGTVSTSRALLSQDPAVILVFGPVALVSLGLVMAILLLVMVVGIRRLVFLSRLIAQFRRGVRSLRASDNAAAEAIFRDLVERAASSAGIRGSALTNLGAVLSREGRYAEAQAALEESLAVPGSSRGRSALVLYNLAWVAFLAQDFAAAAARVQESLANRPPGADLQALVHMMAGRLAARTGDFEAAFSSFGLAAPAAARSGNPERVAQVEVQTGIAEYLRGDREGGRERILAALPAHTTREGRHLAALWLSGLSVLAEGADGRLFLERANQLEGRDLSGEAQSASAYVKA